MRIPAKILAILILLTAIFTVVACDKPNLTAGDITSSTTATYTVTFNGAFSNNGSMTTMASPAYITVTPPATTIGALPTPPTMSGGYTFWRLVVIHGWWWFTAYYQHSHYVGCNSLCILVLIPGNFSKR